MVFEHIYILDLEDGGSKILRNADIIPQSNTAPQTIRPQLKYIKEIKNKLDSKETDCQEINWIELTLDNSTVRLLLFLLRIFMLLHITVWFICYLTLCMFCEIIYVNNFIISGLYLCKVFFTEYC
jgi:hypothetical protein